MQPDHMAAGKGSGPASNYVGVSNGAGAEAGVWPRAGVVAAAATQSRDEDEACNWGWGWSGSGALAGTA